MKHNYYILKNKEELIEYEKGLYDAFIIRTDSNWIKHHYTKIDECRLKPNKPYSDLIIYALKIDGIIQGISTVNKNMKNNDLEKMGFDLSKYKLNSTCEGLHLYMNKKTIGNEFSKVAKEFPEFMIDDLINRGYTNLFGSCQKDLEALYRMVGFERIQSIMLNGEEEILLRYNLEDDMSF